VGLPKFVSRVVARWLLLISVVWIGTGCVSRTAYDSLNDEHVSLGKERERLAYEVRRLTIERDSLEEQWVEAQESYEDERVTRTTLASNLASQKQRADSLDENLDAERLAHQQAAATLAAREAVISSMQSTYDELVTDLESEVSSGQIEIERLREGLRLNVSDEVLFASGSAELDSVGRGVLVKVAGQLKNLRDFIEVRGHTDDRRIHGALAKRYPTNWELAAARASRVVRLLEERGVPGDRLAVISLGPNVPIAPNDTVANRRMNRRIEIRLVPKKGADLTVSKPASHGAVGAAAASEKQAEAAQTAVPAVSDGEPQLLNDAAQAPPIVAAAPFISEVLEAAPEEQAEGSEPPAQDGDRLAEEQPTAPLEAAPES
jgi:chemotaxis protein MotB